jgi:hypothetical protein
MKANPGGQIDPKDVIGRDTFISQIWEILAVQSISMNAERRIGKSTVMRAMVAAPRAGWHPIYRPRLAKRSGQWLGAQPIEARQS